MTLYFNAQDDFTKYTSATVFVKNLDQYKITVPGKIVSATTDGYSVRIKTETGLAVFDTQDVAAVTFQ